MVGSGITFRLAKGFLDVSKNTIIICQDPEQAAYYQNDFQTILPNSEVLFLPSSFSGRKTLSPAGRYDLLQRSETLQKIQQSDQPKVLLTYHRAFCEKVHQKNTIENISSTIQINQVYQFDVLNEKLFEQGFHNVDFVLRPGEFATRGGIIDVFSYAYPMPVRIEFFDDQVERISTFEAKTQRTVERLDSFEVLPDVRQVKERLPLKSLVDVFPQDCNYIFFDLDQLLQMADGLFATNEVNQVKYDQELEQPVKTQFTSKEEFSASLASKNIILLKESDEFTPEQILTIHQEEQPDFNKKFELLMDHLLEYHKQGFDNTIFCSTQPQLGRIQDVFEAIGLKGKYDAKPFPLYSGFRDIDAGCIYYTDHQIFKRYHKFKVGWNKSSENSLSVTKLAQLRVGDFVTHMDHGIGKFAGLRTIEHKGKKQEVIRILYAENDSLDVSIHSLEKISRYNSRDGKPPRIYKLGSQKWKKLKSKTKYRVKELAFDLVKLYAKRNRKIGVSCSEDSYLQAELEASFFYEDTPDQIKATHDVKRDMESSRPMDRLICGDVGFGKTEVAIRAAFKAVDNGFQVAVLVPTTILAFQHYNTFWKRLDDFPVTVDYISRFRNPRQKKEILEGLSSGRIDIIIGTHILVGNSIKFKNLGLLIVDEEQKFGVSVKEKLKNLKHNVDVLTLTATPIPRTLQFSLMAARDISLINTPPPNRHPVETHLIRLDKDLIRDAIRYEMRRRGRVFFVHHRIENIEQVREFIQQLVPEARLVVGHGRKKGTELEELMLGFIDGRYDVLISTTIIENGLDVPQANTIFINHAHRYGLSDLYQMRGRVGRSNINAFAYLITPKLSSVPINAQKRIRSIEEFTELGQGIHVALKDLEIRGAGDILGAEQSGFISEMGFDAYHKILRETIDELKAEGELSLSGSELNNVLVPKEEAVQIVTDLEAYIPKDYVNVVSERMLFYQKINSLDNEKQLTELKEEIKDRFGPWPREFKSLISLVRVKWYAKHLKIEKLVVKDGKCRAYFVRDFQNHYTDNAFSALLNELNKIEHPFRLSNHESSEKTPFWVEIGWIDTFSILLSVFKQLHKAVKYSSVSV